MKYLVSLLLALALSEAKPYSVNPGVGAIYKGPHDTTIIEGPDGSRIDAEPYVPGSIVSKDVKAGAIAPAAPAVAIAPAPIITRVAPIVRPDLDLRPALLAAGPLLNLGESLVNPVQHTEQILHTSPELSGSILTSQNYAPVVTQDVGPIVTQDITHTVGPILSQDISQNVIPIVPQNVGPIVSHDVSLLPQNVGPVISNELSGLHPIVAPVNPLTVKTVSTSSIVSSPQIIQSPSIVHTPSLIENPIIVEEASPVLAQNPNIIQEHVAVGNKIISVPKLVEDNTDLVGPSGTISTRGGDVVVSGPSSTTIKGGGVVASIEKQPELHVKAVEIKPILTEARAVLNPAIAHPPAILQPDLIQLNQPVYH